MPFTVVEISEKNHSRGVRMKYYKAVIPSQKSLHPNGFFATEYYVAAETRDEAKKAALVMLREDDFDNCQYYKSPRVEEISDETYRAKTEKQTDIIETAEIDTYCALLTLFGSQEGYDEGEIADANDLLINPEDEPEAYARYTVLRGALNQALADCDADIDTDAVRKLAADIFAAGELSTEPQDIPVENDVQKVSASGNHHAPEELVNISPDNDVRSAELTGDIPAVTPDAEDIQQSACLLEVFPPVNGKIISGQGISQEMLAGILADIKPGESMIVRWLENETYHAADGYSSTQIRLVRDNGLVALDWYKNAPRKSAVSGALTVGTALHTALLEPECFAEEYLCAPEADLRTKEGKQTLAAFEETAAESGKTVLRKDDFELVSLMRDSALAYPLVAALLEEGEPELSVFFRTDSGVLLKIRPDWLGMLAGVPFILDVKTTDDVTDFGKSVDKYGYHLQAAYYRTIASHVFGLDIDFAFCAVSKRAECGRYPVTLGLLDDEDSQEGLLQVREVIGSLENGGNSVPFAVISRPWWAKHRDRKYREAQAFTGGAA